MQLQAIVARWPVRVLVDSGSTHNFFCGGAILKLGIAVKDRPRLQAVLANGEKVPSGGICKAITLQVGPDSFATDLCFIPLAGFDVVLRIKWL